IAYSFTKSRNSILLAKYVTGFCTSRSTGRRGAETVRAAFRSRAAPPPGRTPPPLAHPPPFPAPGSTLDPSASFSHPPSARAQHPSPGLRLALFANPSRLRRLLPGLHHPSFRAPPLRVRTPCVQSSPDAWPLRTRTPCVRPSPDAWPPLCGPPIARTPVPPALPVCAQEGWRACGRGGARGRGAARVEGTARAREGGGTVPCASPACVQRGRRAGEVRRVVNRGAGMAKPGRRGERKGEVRTAPPAPLPTFAQRVGEHAHARRVARKPGEGEQPGRRRFLANGKGGGTLCPPCPQRACKGGGGRAGGVGCN